MLIWRSCENCVVDRAAFLALCVLTFLVPWDNTVVFAGLGSLSRLVGAGTLGLGLASVLTNQRVRRPHLFLVIAAAFVMWSALTLLWTTNLPATEERVLTYLQVLLFGWLIWQYARTEERQHRLLVAYVLGAYVPALDTIKNYVQGASFFGMGRYTASGFNPNEIAFILALGIPVAWYLTLLARSWLRAAVFALYVPLTMMVVILTASRGALVAALCGLLLIPWSLSKVSMPRKLIMTPVVIVAIVAVTTLVPSASLERLEGTARDIAEGELAGREVIWATALQQFNTRPVSGVGAGAITGSVGRIVTYAAFDAPISAHQTFLEVAAGQGLIGLSLFIAAVVAAFAGTLKMRGLQRKFWAVLALTLFVGLLPRTFDYRKPLWFFIALAAAQSATKSQERERQVPHSRAPGPQNTLVA
jgi:O-antigen ligase